MITELSECGFSGNSVFYGLMVYVALPEVITGGMTLRTCSPVASLGVEGAVGITHGGLV